MAARPRPVHDLTVVTAAGRTTLRWTPPPGWEVRIYATPVPEPPAVPVATAHATSTAYATSTGPWPYPGSGPLPMIGIGPEGSDVSLAAITDSSRLVGLSRSGQVSEAAQVGEVIYTPLTVHGGTAVVGRAVRHLAIEPVRDLRADDRGDSIVLSFQLPPGVTEARVLWRRDQPPTGPDDPYAAGAKVTNTSLEIKGGWHLAAPRDGWAYHVACYPVYRSGGVARMVAAGVSVLARPATRPDPPPMPAASGSSPGGSAGVVSAGVVSGRSVVGAVADPITMQSLGGPTQPRTGGYPLPTATGAVPLPTATGTYPPPMTTGPLHPVPVRPVPEHAPEAQTNPPAGPPTGPASPPPAPVAQPTVTYTVSRSGWRRRTLRVQVHTTGPAGDLILFARPGTVPPRVAAEAHELSRLAAVDQAGTRTIDVTLDGAQLPWGVRLLPALVHPTGWTITQPPDDALVIR